MFIGAAEKVNRGYCGGIGFIVRPHMTDRILSCKILSARLGVLILKINKNTTLKIICCYFPTLKAKDEEVEELYKDIECLLQIKSTFTTICGDFNAKIGIEQNKDKFIGNYGVGNRNHRGERLAEFTQAEELYIMNSFFKKRLAKRWTWASPDETIRNEIDYILADCKRIVHDVETIGKTFFNASSDHRLVRAKIKIDLRREEKARAISNHVPQNLQVNKTKFLHHIEGADWSLKNDIDEDYKHFLATLIDCKKKSTEATPKPSRSRLSPTTLDLLKQRKELKLSNNINEVYKEICKTLRKAIPEDYRQYRQTKLVETVYARSSIKKTERSLNFKQPILTAMLDKNGVLKENREEIENIVKTFYNDLYSSQQQIPRPNITVEEEVPTIFKRRD